MSRYDLESGSSCPCPSRTERTFGTSDPPKQGFLSSRLGGPVLITREYFWARDRTNWQPIGAAVISINQNSIGPKPSSFVIALNSLSRAYETPAGTDKSRLMRPSINVSTRGRTLFTGNEPPLRPLQFVRVVIPVKNETREISFKIGGR